MSDIGGVATGLDDCAILAELDDRLEPPDWTMEQAASGRMSEADILAAATDRAPGPESVQWLSVLDPAQLDDAQRINYLMALDRAQQWLAGEHARTLAVIDRSDASRERYAAEDVACALRMPPAQARTRLATARTLADDLPATMAALRGGVITARQAEAVAEASWPLPRNVRAEFEQRVLRRAGEQTLRGLKDTIRRAVIALDPVTAEQRRLRASSDRTVTAHAAEDGMGELRWYGPAEQVQSAWIRLCARSRQSSAADDRTVDQRRSDLLADAILAGLPLDGLPSVQGRAPTIHVHVNASTLLGRDDLPGYLAGQGPLTAQQARDLAGAQDATWFRILTDPVTGQLVSVESKAYRPPQSLIDTVLACHQMCSFPHLPPTRLALRHRSRHRPRTRWPDTPRQPFSALCRRHHLMKTRGLWAYRVNPDGSWTWRSRTGHRYDSRPPDWIHWMGTTGRERTSPRGAPRHGPDDPCRREDDWYRDLKARLRAEIRRQTPAGNQHGATAAKHALAQVRRQRRKQLRIRRDTTYIPF